MASVVKTLDVEKLIFMYGGSRIGGFASGTYLNIEYDNDRWQHNVGSDGEVARKLNGKKLGTITCTLQQSSVSNDILTAFYAEDLTGNTPKDMIIEDLLGTTIATGAACWIPKLPATPNADDPQQREWKIQVGSLELFVGGN